MRYLDKKTYEKIKRKNICFLTGTGEKAETQQDLSDEETFITSRALLELMIKEGFNDVDYLTLTRENLATVKHLKPDIFLNLTEGPGFDFFREVDEIISKLPVPVTGSQASTSVITTNKFATKKILQKNKIPTPGFFLIENIKDLSQEEITTLKFPVIVKPVFSDGSEGIHQTSVVEDFGQLKTLVAQIFEQTQEKILVEEYIAGREFSPTAFTVDGKINFLPIAELVYLPRKDRKWDIYTYEAKWLYNQEEYLSIPSIAPPENLDKKDQEKIENYCRRIFEIFTLKDYARFDIRFDEKNHIPYFLEINDNPSLEIDPKYSLCVSVEAAGLNLAQFTAIIIKSAFNRNGIKL